MGINRGGDVGKKGVGNFGKNRDTRVVRKNTSRGKGNPTWILGKRLRCLVATSAELKTKRIRCQSNIKSSSVT